MPILFGTLTLTNIKPKKLFKSISPVINLGWGESNPPIFKFMGMS